nr:cytochrome P450 CYP72A616-like [Lolium perenne]
MEAASVEKDGHSGNDLLGLMLQSNRASDSGQRMSTQDVIEELKLFYFAGMETTAALLTWTLVVLGMHPEWQDRAREEVLGVFGTDDTPSFDGLSRLKKVTMVLNEVLRLYPPAVTMNRKTSKETQIGGITYPADIVLEMPIILLHHSPDLWGDDVLEFKPERFAEGISKATKDGQPGFFPFGWGPRICIGQNFTLLEAKMALSMILQRFEWRLSPSYAHAPCTVLTLQPQHGAQIILKSL